MVNKQLGLGQNFLQKLNKLRSRPVKSFSRSRVCRMRSLILAVLLFFLSLGGTLVAPQVRASTSIIQTQGDSSRLVEQAKALYQAGSFEEAVTVWQQAQKAFAARGDKLNQAMALSNLSLTAQQIGRWDRAKEAIALSLSLLQTHEKTPTQLRILGSTLDIQGQLQLAVGEPSRALETWQKAANIYRSIGDGNGETRSRINQAQAMQDLGLYPRACKTLLQALKLDNQNCAIAKKDLQTLNEQSVKMQNAASLQVLGLRSLGNVLRVVGQLEQSQMILSESGQLGQQLGDSQNMAAIYLSLGNTKRALGNRRMQLEKQSQQKITFTRSGDCIQQVGKTKTVEFYQQAASCYQQAESSALPSIKLQAQLNRLSLLVQTHQWQEVPALVSQIQSSLNNLTPSRPAVYAQIKFAQSLMCLQSGLNQNQSRFSSPVLQQCSFVNNMAKSTLSLDSIEAPSWDNISQILKEAVKQAQLLGDKEAEANARGYLGGAYQQMGKLAEARQSTEQALQQISTIEASSTTYVWQWQLGRLYQNQGDQKSALKAYTLAYEILQSLRKDLVAINPEIQFTFRDTVEPVYRELADLLLQPLLDKGEQKAKISQDNLKQARDVIEALQLAELNNFFQEACLTTRPEEIDKFDPNAAVLYSIILPNRLAVILSRPKQELQYYATPLPPSTNQGEGEEVDRVFDDLFATLNPFISSSDPLRPQQILYDWLIRPVEAQLEKDNVKTLVFVLDGVLRGVPVAALYDSKKQEYLIEKYSVALTPGLQLLYSRSLSPERLRTLAGGLAEARQGFSALPAVELEVQEIAEVVPSQVLLNKEFTRDRLQVQINTVPFPIVHLATHGQFSSQAENTFLLTWDDRINVKELDKLLQGREQPNRSPLELLILSACQTAAGDKRAVLGLAGVAVRSGARSTLATLWSVRDESTAKLMSKFYLELNKPGISKAEALRQAQLSLLKSPQYQHPYYWAPFVLVGNWF